jgi:hypothetical protein
MKKNILTIGAILGTTVGLIAISLPTFAATLIDGGTDETTFQAVSNISKIGEVEGIVGGGSKEVFFGINGSSTLDVHALPVIVPESEVTVPEPNLIVGLLGLGALGVTSTRKRKKVEVE